MINLDHKQSKLHIWFYYLLTDMWLCTLILLELNIFDKIIRQYKKINPICYLLWESALLWPMQLESKKGHFELTNEEFLMIIKYMNYWIKHHYSDKHNTCSSYSSSQFSISFIDLCVLQPLPVHSNNSHFGASTFSFGYYELVLFSLHLDS